MALSAFTGMTLDHAGDLEARTQMQQVEAVMPPEPLVQPERGTGEGSDVAVYVAMLKPGGDAWPSIDREIGRVVYEHTSRGTISPIEIDELADQSISAARQHVAPPPRPDPG